MSGETPQEARRRLAQGELNDRGMLWSWKLDDGRVVDVWQLLLGQGQITISRSATTSCWYAGWMYEDVMTAIMAAVVWDPTAWDEQTGLGEPTGWTRAMYGGRADRYPPGGDRDHA